MSRKTLVTLIFVFSSLSLFGQASNWQKEVETALYEFQQCGGPLPSNYPCNQFVAMALKKVYEIDDFTIGNSYLLANQIADYVSNNSDRWTKLGNADAQAVLNEAQGYANVGKAVIAVLKNNSGSGHVAIILPGQTMTSGNWGLKCPNSASFFIDQPEKAYVSKHLGYAFPSNNKGSVEIWGRNY
ncbi:hypothetical protein [uncultured Imperialibacter sp.]|uniref:hypothetical protein n=1 Tax=uncultured Imperialibacter sp. TaxID=1672639 RepID=UPI0030D7B03A|tara:strand:- start:39081 stop:39635 length:555 start_codon:yes stop_codon:yes gene_type:complete